VEATFSCRCKTAIQLSDGHKATDAPASADHDCTANPDQIFSNPKNSYDSRNWQWLAFQGQLPSATCTKDSRPHRSIVQHPQQEDIGLQDNMTVSHQGILDGGVPLLLGLHLLQPEELLTLQLIQLSLWYHQSV